MVSVNEVSEESNELPATGYPVPSTAPDKDANNKGGREGADAIKHTSPRGTSEGGNSKGKCLILSLLLYSHQFSSVAQLCLTPQTTACQASLSITKSRSLPRLMSIESVMPSNNLFLVVPFSSYPQSIPIKGPEITSCLPPVSSTATSQSCQPSGKFMVPS